MDKHHILIVDDRPDTVDVLKDRLVWLGHDVEQATSGLSALDRLWAAGSSFDLVFLDVQMPGMDGLQTLAEIRKNKKAPPVVMMSAHGETETAIEAVKRGAYDYVLKPFSMDQVEGIVRTVFLRATPATIQPHLLPPHSAAPDEGRVRDPRMLEIYKSIGRVAMTEMNVLLLGESGSGKGLAARLIHRHSARSAGPFMEIHCAALPEALFESELFGHERGAFTGAEQAKPGLLERARGGTLFLDEVGDIPLSMQVKILRVLQEKTFERLGGRESLKLDARIVSATNRDLEKMVREETFREDLFYRLNGITLTLPPLRERTDDLPLLTEFFLSQHAKKMKKNLRGLTLKALTKITQYPWPGNVRELDNVLQRSVARCPGDVLLVEDLALPSTEGVSGITPSAPASGTSFRDARRTAVAEYEKQTLDEALRRHDGNISQTAEELGMHRQQLQTLLKKHNLR